MSAAPSTISWCRKCGHFRYIEQTRTTGIIKHGQTAASGFLTEIRVWRLPTRLNRIDRAGAHDLRAAKPWYLALDVAIGKFTAKRHYYSESVGVQRCLPTSALQFRWANP